MMWFEVLCGVICGVICGVECGVEGGEEGRVWRVVVCAETCLSSDVWCESWRVVL